MSEYCAATVVETTSTPKKEQKIVSNIYLIFFITTFRSDDQKMHESIHVNITNYDQTKKNNKLSIKRTNKNKTILKTERL